MVARNAANDANGTTVPRMSGGARVDISHVTPTGAIGRCMQVWRTIRQGAQKRRDEEGVCEGQIMLTHQDIVRFYSSCQRATSTQWVTDSNPSTEMHIQVDMLCGWRARVCY